MKYWLIVLALAGVVSAQEAVSVKPGKATASEHTYPVSQSDLYCAGFMSKPLSRDHFVAAGLQTPQQARYAIGDFIYLSGTGYEPGVRVSIVRQAHDPNRFAPFAGQDSLVKHNGEIYADLGYATVTETRPNNIAIAKVEFTCDPIVPGDQVVPFVVRQPVSYRQRSTAERFPDATSSVSGRIVASRNFEQFLGPGSNIYLNVGAKRGVKPGDYFRIVRGYERRAFDLAAVESYGQTLAEDTQKNAPRYPSKKLKELPHHLVGEAVVLSTHDDTATAIVSFVLEEVHVGDTVELEGEGK